MKADVYVVIMGRYLFWIWLGLGGYCSVFAKPKKRLRDLPSDGTAGFASSNNSNRDRVNYVALTMYKDD